MDYETARAIYGCAVCVWGLATVGIAYLATDLDRADKREQAAILACVNAGPHAKLAAYLHYAGIK